MTFMERLNGAVLSALIAYYAYRLIGGDEPGWWDHVALYVFAFIAVLKFLSALADLAVLKWRS